MTHSPGKMSVISRYGKPATSGSGARPVAGRERPRPHHGVTQAFLGVGQFPLKGANALLIKTLLDQIPQDHLSQDMRRGSVQRRRHWTTEEKVRIVEETYLPDNSVSIVARRHGISANQLFTWRRLMAR